MWLWALCLLLYWSFPRLIEIVFSINMLSMRFCFKTETHPISFVFFRIIIIIGKAFEVYGGAKCFAWIHLMLSRLIRIILQRSGGSGLFPFATTLRNSCGIWSQGTWMSQAEYLLYRWGKRRGDWSIITRPDFELQLWKRKQYSNRDGLPHVMLLIF